MLHVMNADQKIKKYIKVAATLTVITVVELTVVILHFLPGWLITCLVVALSLSKAYLVAWYFMHLNHERIWTRLVALLPLGMVVYAGVLLADQKARPPSQYIGAPARTFTPPHGLDAHAGTEAHAGPEATGSSHGNSHDAAHSGETTIQSIEIHTDEAAPHDATAVPHDAATPGEEHPEDKATEGAGGKASGAQDEWK
jgi:cytochrome c oxidase subunit IV